MSYRIAHIGDPMPLPRPRVRILYPKGNAVAQLYTPNWAVRHKEEIAAEWQRAGHPCFEAGVYLVVDATFVFDRPAGHYGTGRNSGVVKPQHLNARPGKGGNRNASGHRTGADEDNLAKLAKDALSGVAYADDGQIAESTVRKLYIDQAGVEAPQSIIEVRELEPVPNLGLVAA